MPTVYGFQYSSYRLIRVASHRFGNRGHVSEASDHLFNCGAAIGFAEAAGTLILGRRDDSGGKGRAKRTRLYDQYVDAERLEFIGQRLVNGFDGEFARGI